MTALVAMSDVCFDRYSEPIQPRAFRLAAYRQFTWWIHSPFGRSVWRVIPACVVIEIPTTIIVFFYYTTPMKSRPMLSNNVIFGGTGYGGNVSRQLG